MIRPYWRRTAVVLVAGAVCTARSPLLKGETSIEVAAVPPASLMAAT